MPDAAPRRGRPARHGLGPEETRDRLVRRGMELLTEQGFASLTAESVVTSTGIPKGSFYHHFPTKMAFVGTVLEAYDTFLRDRLARHLEHRDLPPLARLEAYVTHACEGLARFDFTRGCLVGNLGQDLTGLDPALRVRLEACLAGWEAQVATCLQEAQARGDLSGDQDPAVLAHAFWVGWEGAILRARLQRSPAPLVAFFAFFRSALRGPTSLEFPCSRPF